MQIVDRFDEIPVVRNSPRASLFWVSLLRIAIGLMFLTTWYSNFGKDLYTPDGLESFLRGQLNEDSLGFYRTFIEDVVIPIKGVFAPFQLVTEFLLGLALLIGLFTRPAAVIGAFFLLNTYLISVGTGEWAWSYFIPISALGVIFFTNAGRALGVDGWLKGQYGESRFGLW
jgi:NADH dehydrogenase